VTRAVDVEIDGAVAVVRVDNPPVNAIDAEVLDGLGGATAELGGNDAVRAVVLTGVGEHAFMAGADLRELQRMLAGAASIDAHTAAVRRVFGAWERLGQPVVAAVQASAVGGGLEAALLCDLIVADPAARFGLPEVRLGLIPGAGGASRLLRRVGVGRAKELLLLGGTIDAEEARLIGLVNRVSVPGGALEAAVDLARRLAALPATAVRAAKLALESDLEAGLDSEHALFVELFGTTDAREGVSAFLEKREPRFVHR
jgi:enoyl-CoA hydratase/carnithine racemase